MGKRSKINIVGLSQILGLSVTEFIDLTNLVSHDLNN